MTLLVSIHVRRQPGIRKMSIFAEQIHDNQLDRFVIDNGTHHQTVACCIGKPGFR